MHAYDPRWAKKWRVDHDRGIHRYVDAAPARAHVQTLLAGGASRRAVAQKAGITPTVITRLLTGQAHLQRETAAAILAVTPAHILDRDGHEDFVPAIGARRRIQALQAIGHTSTVIAAHAGPGTTAAIIHNVAKHPGQWISRRNHDRVVVAYSALWDKPGTSLRVKAQVARLGYAPPMAWDDVDDPHARPQHDLSDPAELDVDEVAVERRAAGDHTIVLTRDERLLAVQHLHATGLNDQQIADRIGYAVRTVLRDRQHLGLPANEQTGKHRTSHRTDERKTA